MVIDRNETVAPLFWYLYTPLTAPRRDDNHAVGSWNVQRSISCPRPLYLQNTRV